MHDQNLLRLLLCSRGIVRLVKYEDMLARGWAAGSCGLAVEGVETYLPKESSLKVTLSWITTPLKALIRGSPQFVFYVKTYFNKKS